MITESLNQCLGLVGMVYPQSLNGNTSTAAIDISKAGQVLFVPSVGTLGTNATVDFVVTGCTISNGTFAAINTTAITQITAANSAARVTVHADQINALGLGYKYIQGKITVGTAASVVSVHAFAGDVRHEPASALDLNTVTSTVTL